MRPGLPAKPPMHLCSLSESEISVHESNAKTKYPVSCNFKNPWGWELGLKDSVPKSAGNAKAVFVIGKVVLEVIFLQLSVV